MKIAEKKYDDVNGKQTFDQSDQISKLLKDIIKSEITERG